MSEAIATTVIVVIALTAATLVVAWIAVRTVTHMATGAAFNED